VYHPHGQQGPSDDPRNGPQRKRNRVAQRIQTLRMLLWGLVQAEGRTNFRRAGGGNRLRLDLTARDMQSNQAAVT
jgi:hypothetical protein